MLELRLDCRHFRGDKPCRLGALCKGCSGYEPMGARVLVIKLDAIGDVARTTPILRPLRKKYRPCHVTWLAAPAAFGLVRNHPLIEVALPYGNASLERLRVERFDLVLSLDKTQAATSVAMNVTAPLKLGFGLSRYGTVYPLNEEAEYAFQLGLDDELKFRRNQRTYQDVIFEVCCLPYGREGYELPLPDEERALAARKLRVLGIGEEDTVIGLNLGGGVMFAHKMWDVSECAGFLRLLREKTDCKVVLFGATREREKTEELLASGIEGVVGSGLDNTLKQFQALLARCNVLVGGDSLGMHLAIAEKVPQVVLFGPTCSQEIELYGRGEKIVAPVDCAPCYSKRCARSLSCMSHIDPAEVLVAVERLLSSRGKDS